MALNAKCCEDICQYEPTAPKGPLYNLQSDNCIIVRLLWMEHNNLIPLTGTKLGRTIQQIGIFCIFL